jgi:murein DD-endopeptidase MepM/ murein hydrolase activator NlpD
MHGIRSSGIAIILALSAHGALAQTLMEPVDATCISSPFGPRNIVGHPEAGTFHYGIDLPVPEGTPVWAAASGTVLRVQHKGPGGLEVLLQNHGFVTVYSHLASVSNRLILDQTPVTAGELVGYVGHTGLTFGAHLYFGMLHDGVPIDPTPVLGLPRCSGTVSETPAAILARGGLLPPTRHYSAR